MIIRTIHLLGLLSLFLMVGCTAIGPATIARDRFEYSTAIAESWKEMMLLNIVKLRYGDTPVFLEVGSIVNQYTLERELEGTAALKSGDLVGEGLELVGSGRYSDRPTITYSPIMGEKFSKSLLTPLPPHALFMLIQSGWDSDFILRVCVSAINDLYNSSGKQQTIRRADDDFEQLLDHLSFIQQAGGLGARLVERDGKRSLVYFKDQMDEDLEAHVAEVRRLLGLNPAAREFRLVYGTTPSSDGELAVLTRSMLDIIAELSQRVEVPHQHIEQHRASPGFSDKTPTTGEMRSRIRIRSSADEPADAFLAVRYRTLWFSIDDTDYRSKRMFSFLLFLLSLAEGGPQGMAPILTLPAG
jgi:hypothetical protein